jgi:phosphonopyruvate decarboxylase
VSVSSKEELKSALSPSHSLTLSPLLLEIRVQKGNRKDLGRPTTTPIENKEALMDFLKQ